MTIKQKKRRVNVHDNSLLAYAAVKPKAATIRQQVYDAIAASADGLTREELEAQLGIAGNTLRPRVRELMKPVAHILESGSRLTESGHKAAVLRINEPHQTNVLDQLATTKGAHN